MGAVACPPLASRQGHHEGERMAGKGWLGMDPVRAREVADALRGHAQTLDRAGSEVAATRLLLGAFWGGADAERFRRDSIRAQALLEACATDVRQMSRDLYAQVQEQVEVSAVDGGHGSGPLGPLSDTPETTGTDIPLDPGVDPLSPSEVPGSPWVPQGVTVDASGELTITTLYNEDHPGEGLLVIQDADGNVIRTVRLSGIDHYGGVAVHGDHVWVSGGGQVQLYSLSAIRASDDGDPVEPRDSFPVKGASTVTYHDGQLWTAQFDGDRSEHVYAYDVKPDGTVEQREVRVPLPFGDDLTVATTHPSQVLDGTKEMQGIAVNDRYIYLSSSEGRDSEHSVLTRIDRVTGERESVDVPSNMAEGIALRGDQLITTYESGAHKYADGREPRSTTTVRDLR